MTAGRDLIHYPGPELPRVPGNWDRKRLEGKPTCLPADTIQPVAMGAR